VDLRFLRVKDSIRLNFLIDPRLRGRAVLRREGGSASSGIRANFHLYISDEGDKGYKGDKTNWCCTMCVRYSQHTATKETRGATFSQSCCRKRDARTSCKAGSDGSSVEKST
jgi:hypothetical protein